MLGRVAAGARTGDTRGKVSFTTNCVTHNTKPERRPHTMCKQRCDNYSSMSALIYVYDDVVSVHQQTCSVTLNILQAECEGSKQLKDCQSN